MGCHKALVHSLLNIRPEGCQQALCCLDCAVLQDHGSEVCQLQLVVPATMAPGFSALCIHTQLLVNVAGASHADPGSSPGCGRRSVPCYQTEHAQWNSRYEIGMTLAGKAACQLIEVHGGQHIMYAADLQGRSTAHAACVQGHALVGGHSKQHQKQESW